MAKKMYIGNNSNIAKQIKKIYIGDESNIAKKIKKAYIGDENGIAKLFFEGHNRYLFIKYLYNYSEQDKFGYFNRLDDTEFEKISTNNLSGTAFSFNKNDANTVVGKELYTSGHLSTFNFYKKVNNSYILSFTLTEEKILSCIPNSGDTAYFHSNCSKRDSDYFGLSENGEYFYTTIILNNCLTASYDRSGYLYILIFKINNGDFELANIILIDRINEYYGESISSVCRGTASNDLSVFSITYFYNSIISNESHQEYGAKIVIGGVNGEYNCCSLQGRLGYENEYNVLDSNIEVSEDGNYFYTQIKVENPDIYVFSGHKMCYGKIDKINKTITPVIDLGGGHTISAIDYKFIGNDYIYSLITSSPYYDEGQVYLNIYKKSGTDFIKTTNNLVLSIPKFPTEYYYSASEESGKAIYCLALDIENNIIIFFDNSGQYDICSLIGNNGVYTGYDRIDGGRLFYTDNDPRPKEVYLK